MRPIRVCFVCLGNICRSPTAEAVMRKAVADAGLSARIEVDSAGTGAWHAGEGPDRRSVAAARTRGISVGGKARRFADADWDRFDYVVAMDESNLETLESRAKNDRALQKLSLFRSFDPSSPPGASVPDPYYSEDGFEEVLDLCEAGCRGLLKHIVGRYGLVQ
jgi:protein-tyrosine phosphatase